jgi:hypothetical protein
MPPPGDLHTTEFCAPPPPTNAVTHTTTHRQQEFNHFPGYTRSRGEAFFSSQHAKSFQTIRPHPDRCTTFRGRPVPDSSALLRGYDVGIVMTRNLIPVKPNPTRSLLSTERDEVPWLVPNSSTNCRTANSCTNPGRFNSARCWLHYYCSISPHAPSRTSRDSEVTGLCHFGTWFISPWWTWKIGGRGREIEENILDEDTDRVQCGASL